MQRGSLHKTFLLLPNQPQPTSLSNWSNVNQQNWWQESDIKNATADGNYQEPTGRKKAVFLRKDRYMGRFQKPVLLCLKFCRVCHLSKILMWTLSAAHTWCRIEGRTSCAQIIRELDSIREAADSQPPVQTGGYCFWYGLNSRVASAFDMATMMGLNSRAKSGLHSWNLYFNHLLGKIESYCYWKLFDIFFVEISLQNHQIKL